MSGRGGGIIPQALALLKATGGVEVVHFEDRILDAGVEALAKGERALAPISDEGRIVGLISADNLLHRRPITVQDKEILVLYATAFSRMCSHRRLDEERRNLARFPSKNPNPVLRIDESGKVLYSNKAGLPLLNDLGGAIGQPAPEPWRRLASEVCRSGAGKEVEFHHRSQIFSMTVVAVPDGAYVNIYGNDITDGKNAEKQLAASEQKYRALFEGSPEAISVTVGGKIVDVNPAWLRLHDVTDRREVIGMDVIEIIYPEDRGMLLARRDMSPEQRDQGYEIRDVRRDGAAVDVEVYSKGISLGNVEAILTTVRDITKRKRAEKEKTGLQEQLLQSQKMEAIGQLAGGVAHDFNNLLTTIRGFTELLMMRTPNTGAEHEDLKRVLDASDRAAGLVRQLLLFSRKQPMEMKLLNPNEIVKDLLKMLGRLIGEDIEVSLDLGRAPRTIRADPGSIEQVIVNLAVNARDAMPNGGKFTIRTQNAVIQRDECKRMPRARPGEFVCLSVADSGTGMDKETLDHIFEPFFTTKGIGKGTGLGLSVVYGVVEQHGGWIAVDTQPGKGSEFKVYLPASQDRPAEKPEKTADVQQLRGNGERILVVEDEEEILKFVVRVLSSKGFVVFEASTAEFAINAFERQNSNIDVLFTDCVLPDRTGLHLVEELLSRKPDLRVLMASGYTDDRSQWTAIRERGFRFLQKPYGARALVQAVWDVTHRTG